jgi:hypothetical protein
VTINDSANSFLELERNTEVFGEMVKCAERQHAHALSRAGQLRRNCADCAIAARRYNRGLRGLESVANCRAHLVPVFDGNDMCVYASGLKEGGNL